MAGDVKISIKDPESGLAWLNTVTLINEDYHDAMKEAGQVLEDMQNFADGTLVDEFVNCGSKIITAADATFQAIDAIADTVHSFLDVTGDFIKDTVSVVKTVAGIFGV